MKHILVERSTPEQIALADEAADWLLDAVACATQDKRFLRGERDYDEMISEAIMGNGKIACLRVLHKAQEPLNE
jgi:hypothetical protein